MNIFAELYKALKVEEEKRNGGSLTDAEVELIIDSDIERMEKHFAEISIALAMMKGIQDYSKNYKKE